MVTIMEILHHVRFTGATIVGGLHYMAGAVAAFSPETAARLIRERCAVPAGTGMATATQHHHAVDMNTLNRRAR